MGSECAYADANWPVKPAWVFGIHWRMISGYVEDYIDIPGIFTSHRMLIFLVKEKLEREKLLSERLPIVQSQLKI